LKYKTLYTSIPPLRLNEPSFLRSCVQLLLLLVCPLLLDAQDIGIRNPSLEGVPAQYRAPGQWLVVVSTPDIQPGVTGVLKPASNGATYMGFRGGTHWLEAIAQKLNTDLKKNHKYRLTMDILHAKGYDSATCYGALAIYGGITLTDTLELLWQSGPFYNTDWQKITAEFTPKENSYPYLVIGGDVRLACDNAYGIALGVDNLSDTLRELPHVTYEVLPACKGMMNGAINVSAEGVYPPFSFEWNVPGVSGHSLNNVGAGVYVVTTRGANGASVRDTIIMSETSYDGDARIESIGCTGEDRNRIILNTTGGIPPYTYYLNGARDGKMSPEFANLRAGIYNVIVIDARGCIDTINNLTIPQPTVFTVAPPKVTGMSCMATDDAQLILPASGGVPPYTYSIPGRTPQRDSIFSNLRGGVYHYNIVDAQDCGIDGNVDIPFSTFGCAIYMPNAFTPDGDGQNDIFRAKVFDKVSAFRMCVYNRWGQLLFVTNDIQDGWRGDHKGVLMPAGAYLWTVTYRDHSGQDVKQTGSVMLLK